MLDLSKLFQNWRRYALDERNLDFLAKPVIDPDTGEVLHRPEITEPATMPEAGPDGQTQFLDIPDSEGYRIWHEMPSSLAARAKSFIDYLISAGVTNPWVIAGALGTAMKESGISSTGEKGSGSVERLATGGGYGPRIRRIFKYHTGKPPSPAALAQLAGSRKGIIAQFNIAYGYSPILNPDSKRAKSNPRYRKWLEKLTKRNLAAGVEYKKEIGQYTSYQGGSAISHKIKVVSGGSINPYLFNPNLPGYKYRGRGPIQTTFKSSYLSALRKAGFDRKEIRRIMANPDLVVKDPNVAMKLSAGQIKLTYKKTLKNKTRPGYPHEPASLEEGLAFMILLAMGGGKRLSSLKSTHQRAASKMEKYKVAMHVPDVQPGSTAPAEGPEASKPGLSQAQTPSDKTKVEI